MFAFAFFCAHVRVAADVWEKDVWDFQAKSGSSGCGRLFLHLLGKIAVQKMSGNTPGSPRHPSSRHPRSSALIWTHLRSSALFVGFCFRPRLGMPEPHTSGQSRNSLSPPSFLPELSKQPDHLTRLKPSYYSKLAKLAGNLTGWVAFRLEGVRETEGENQN